MLNNLRSLDECDLTVETCISELVKIALKQRACAIAVRFDYEKRKIQVVDNSNGYTKCELASIFGEQNEVSIELEKICKKIRNHAHAVIITSKHQSSSYTYVKVANKNRDKLIQGYDRPSKGTTVTIYDYNSSNWLESDKNQSISYLLATLAFNNLKVSFSLRNDNEDRIIFSVGKPHSPWEVIKQTKINQDSKKVLQSVSQVTKHSKIDSVKDTGIMKENSGSNLLNVSLPGPTHDQNHSITEIDVCSPLSAWSNWSYKPKPLATHQNTNVDSNIFFSSSEQIDVSNDTCINLTQLSVWSEWNYHPQKSDFNCTDRNTQQEFFPISQSMNNCTQVIKCRISSNTINSLEIIKQINSEFIVAVANENGKKLLILIDQHAIHERIRYEWLIETYREENSYNYKSVRLHKDLLISNFDENLLNLIRMNKEVPMRVGIHVKGIISSNSCIVDAVPRCFLKSKRIYNDDHEMYRLMKNVKKLLLEVANGLAHNVLPPVLPITINDMIAKEACHGAIRFGDPLTVKECTLLVQALQHTKAPTRCAHGRPSIIPLLDLKDLEKQKSFKNKKLNLASLKR